jgi:hypothetical protein
MDHRTHEFLPLAKAILHPSLHLKFLCSKMSARHPLDNKELANSRKSTHPKSQKNTSNITNR